jgi:hypothetical protein
VLFAGGNTPLDQKVAQFGRSVAHRFNDAGIDMFINVSGHCPATFLASTH